MRYLNMPCVYCGKNFAEDDDVVTCPTCGSPHHRECWKEQDRCANAQLHTQGFEWKVPEDVKNEKQTAKKVQEPQAVADSPEQPKTVECPFCGAQNYANELYCSVCHEPIHQNASADAGEPLQDEEQREKMYADFRTYGGLDPQSSVGEISVQEYSAYVGEKSGSYIRKFMTMHTFNRPFLWNWAAFLSAGASMLMTLLFGISCFSLGPVWFFYRKMRKAGALFLCLLLALCVASAVVYSLDPAYWEYMERSQEVFTDFMLNAQSAGADAAQLADEMMLNAQNAALTFSENCSEVTRIWSYISEVLQFYILPILSGFFATKLYYKKAKSDILQSREQHVQSPDYLQRLKLKGGVSVGGAVGAAVACFVIFMLQQYLPLILRSLGIV